MNQQKQQWVLVGLLFGLSIGLLMAMVLLLLLTRPAPPPLASPPNGFPADATIFVSEESLSRIASQVIGQPVKVDFEPNGRVFVSTRTGIGPFEPVVKVELLLQMEGTNVASYLRAVKVGFLTIPARWLPDDIQQTTAIIGESIKAQTPPDFTLVGVNTTSDGLVFLLTWVGG